MATKYDYNRPLNIEEADDVETAIWFAILNCEHYQLGWGFEECKRRLGRELRRVFPSETFDQLEQIYGWKLKGSSLLDVGAGQGGTVLEALERGAKAWGVEPGEEFCQIGQMRLKENGFDDSRIKLAPGERLPFPDNHFDYVISLQVMEHVENPQPIIEEMYRVLKPNGECFITCANYLSFREDHYRVPWLPLFPKTIAGKYLKILGKDPHFLKKYVYYTTYPQMWRISKKAGFHNRTYDTLIDNHLNGINSKKLTSRIVKYLDRLPESFRNFILKNLLHMRYTFTLAIRLMLKKKSN